MYIVEPLKCIVAWDRANRKVAQVSTVPSPHDRSPSSICPLTNIGFVIEPPKLISSGTNSELVGSSCAVELLLQFLNPDLSTLFFEFQKLTKESNFTTLLLHCANIRCSITDSIQRTNPVYPYSTRCDMRYEALKDYAPGIKRGTVRILHFPHLNTSNKGQAWKCKGRWSLWWGKRL